MWPTCEHGTISNVPPHIHVCAVNNTRDTHRIISNYSSKPVLSAPGRVRANTVENTRVSIDECFLTGGGGKKERWILLWKIYLYLNNKWWRGVLPIQHEKKEKGKKGVCRCNFEPLGIVEKLTSLYVVKWDMYVWWDEKWTAIVEKDEMITRAVSRYRSRPFTRLIGKISKISFAKSIVCYLPREICRNWDRNGWGNRFRRIFRHRSENGQRTPIVRRGSFFGATESKRTLNDNSRFSPPHMSKPLSYVPRRSKNFLSMANSPPAMVGDHTGSAELLWRFFSRSGTTCQLNCKQRKNDTRSRRREKETHIFVRFLPQDVQELFLLRHRHDFGTHFSLPFKYLLDHIQTEKQSVTGSLPSGRGSSPLVSHGRFTRVFLIRK